VLKIAEPGVHIKPEFLESLVDLLESLVDLLESLVDLLESLLHMIETLAHESLLPLNGLLNLYDTLEHNRIGVDRRRGYYFPEPGGEIGFNIIPNGIEGLS